MQETEFAVLELFRTNPKTEFSTSEIVELITPGYDRIKTELLDTDLERVASGKSRKAELHRLTLYYLNKLVRKGLLTIKTVGRNKERVFACLQDPQELSPAYRALAGLQHHTITPALGIEGFEDKGIVARYEPSTWVERVNSILLESTFFKNLKDLSSAINNTLQCVNDVVGVNNFETIIQALEPQVVVAALKALNKIAESHARHLTFIIDLTNVQKDEILLKVVKGALDSKLKHITFVFDCEVKEFQDHRQLFKDLVKLYSLAGESLFIKNQSIYNAPYIVGRAGPYTFAEREWKNYKTEFLGKMPGLVCSNAAFLVDMQRLLENGVEHHAGGVIELMGRIAKSFLLTNAEQYERSEHFLQGLTKYSPSNVQNFFMFSRNFVRFWNYGWKTPAYDQKFVISYLGESKRAVDEYCISEETIYKSCGMPTRFRIAYSCTDQPVVSKIFSKAVYERIVVKNPTDFFSDEKINNIISTKEEIFTHFDGGDRITFDRPVPRKPEDAVTEISYILNSFRLPFFRYHFINQINTPLTQFI